MLKKEELMENIGKEDTFGTEVALEEMCKIFVVIAEVLIDIRDVLNENKTLET